MTTHSYAKIRNKFVSINRNDDNWLIGVDGGVRVSSDVAIYEDASVVNSDVRIAGTVSSRGDHDFAIFAGGRNGKWLVEATGSVRGDSGFFVDGHKTDLFNNGLIRAADGYGAWFDHGNHSIVNSGRVVSLSGVGLALRDGAYSFVNDGLVNASKAISGANAEIRIVNETGGEIRGEQVAIQLSGAYDSTITNSGLITCQLWAIYMGKGENLVVNSGDIRGFVNLGGGNDIFTQSGGSFSGYIYLGGGNDRFTYEGGLMAVPGGKNLQVTGGSGNDVFITGEFRVFIREGATGGVDRQETTLTTTLAANVENLVLRGDKPINGAGNGSDNRIIGNGADNFLIGYGGADRLDGRGGADKLLGGTGLDVFVFATGYDADTIDDWETGTDRINLRGLDGVNNFTDLLAVMTEAGGDVVITVDSDMLTITSVSLAALAARDFIF